MSVGLTDVGIWDGLTLFPLPPSLFGIFWSLNVCYDTGQNIWESLGTRLGCCGNETRVSREWDWDVPGMRLGCPGMRLGCPGTETTLVIGSPLLLTGSDAVSSGCWITWKPDQEVSLKVVARSSSSYVVYSNCTVAILLGNIKFFVNSTLCQLFPVVVKVSDCYFSHQQWPLLIFRLQWSS